MSSDIQSALELLQTNNYSSGMVTLLSVNDPLTIWTNVVAIVTAVIYDYRERYCPSCRYAHTETTIEILPLQSLPSRERYASLFAFNLLTYIT